MEPNPIIAGVKRRHRLAEPEPELSSLSHREQRAILREKMGIIAEVFVKSCKMIWKGLIFRCRARLF